MDEPLCCWVDTLGGRVLAGGACVPAWCYRVSGPARDFWVLGGDKTLISTFY